MQCYTQTLLSGATATGASSAGLADVHGTKRTFQAYGSTSAGAGAATIKIQVSNVAANAADTMWLDLGTISLTLGTTVTSDGLASDAAWKYVRANVTAISGTNAAVTVVMANHW